MGSVQNDEDSAPVHVVGLIAVWYKCKSQENSWIQQLENTCWLKTYKLFSLKPTDATLTLAEKNQTIAPASAPVWASEVTHSWSFGPPPRPPKPLVCPRAVAAQAEQVAAEVLPCTHAASRQWHGHCSCHCHQPLVSCLSLYSVKQRMKGLETRTWPSRALDRQPGKACGTSVCSQLTLLAHESNGGLGGSPRARGSGDSSGKAQVAYE